MMSAGAPMFHALLFTFLTLLFALFAFAAAGAGVPVIAVCAGLLGLWTADGAWRSARRIRIARTTSRSIDGRP